MTKHFPFALIACGLAVTCQCAVAQNEVDTIWKKLEARDAAAVAAHIKWKEVMRSSPMPGQDPEKMAAAAAAKAQQQGETEQMVQQTRASVFTGMSAYKMGFTIHETFDYQRVNEAIRCDIVAEVPGAAPTRSGKLPLVHHVDIDDGTNVINMSAPGADAPRSGRLSRDKEWSLALSAQGFGEPMLYANAPLLVTFPKSEASLKIVDQNTVVIEKRFFHIFNQLARLTLNRKTLLPSKFEIIAAVNGKVHKSYDISGYKRYADNIWFPSSIVMVRRLETGTQLDERRYSLESASFSPTAINAARISAIPPGSIIQDTRFGAAQPGRSYRLESRVPTDDEYTRLIANAAITDMSSIAHAQRKQRLLSAAALGIPLSIICLCAMLLVRRRSKLDTRGQ